MRWYLNEASLQGQFPDSGSFLLLLQDLISTCFRYDEFRNAFFTTRTLLSRRVSRTGSLRETLAAAQDRDFRNAVLLWLDKTGPFIDQDRVIEVDDYFECLGHDVTDGGLGEAARRVKLMGTASAFSFVGGATEFGVTPLPVVHGLREAPIGKYYVRNVWDVGVLSRMHLANLPAPRTWRGLVESARVRFSGLVIPDSVFENASLAREPFETVIAERVIFLLGLLNDYVEGRLSDGKEEDASTAIVREFFTGDGALFTGESSTNQAEFKRDLTFVDPLDPMRSVFAHWHGKIRHRVFRLHFVWPLAAAMKQLGVVYLGPKITKK